VLLGNREQQTLPPGAQFDVIVYDDKVSVATPGEYAGKSRLLAAARRAGRHCHATRYVEK